MAVSTIIRTGLDMKPHEKADLEVWPRITEIDPTLCHYTSYQFLHILADQYREPDDAWEQELRDFIRSIRYNDKVYVDYFIASILKADTMLQKVTYNKKGVGLETLYETVKTEVVDKFGEIDAYKSDGYTRGIHASVETYFARFDYSVSPVWEEDTSPKKRNLAFKRDWSNLDAIVEMTRRVRNNNQKCDRLDFLSEYHIEARQPKASRKITMGGKLDLKLTEVDPEMVVYDVDGQRHAAKDALLLLERELDVTHALEASGQTLARSSAFIRDEAAHLNESLFYNTMNVANSGKHPPTSGPLKSLAGGPGGPRRFTAMQGQATNRANAPYLGVNPATQGVGRGGDGHKPRFTPKSDQPKPPDGKPRFDRTIDRARMRARSAERPSDRPPPPRDRGRDSGATVTQMLRRKSELMYKLGTDAQEALKSKDFDLTSSKIDKFLQVCSEVMIHDIPHYDSDADAMTAHSHASSRGSSFSIVDGDSDEETGKVLDVLFSESASADVKADSLKQFLHLQESHRDATSHDDSKPSMMVHITSELLHDHALLLNQTKERKRSPLIQDTGATRTIQGGYNGVKKKIKLKRPASVAQGTEGADTLATEVGITERAIATGSKDKVAFVDVDITLIAPKLRSNLMIKGMTPAYERGMRTGPQTNYLYHKSTKPIDIDGNICDNYAKATDELKRASAPVFRMPSGLPYTETMSVEDAIAEGYTLVDIYSMKPYVYEEALANLTKSLASHGNEAYFMDAVTLVTDAQDSLRGISIDTTKKTVTFDTDDNDVFHDAKSSHEVMWDDIPNPSVEHFSDNYEIYYSPSTEPVPGMATTRDAQSRTRKGTRAGPWRRTQSGHRVSQARISPRKDRDTASSAQSSSKPKAWQLRNWAASLGLLLSVVTLCYGKSTESSMALGRNRDDSLPFYIKAGCEKELDLRKRFEELNPMAESHDDMFKLNQGLREGTICRDLWHAHCAIITTPCINKTSLKDYNRSEYNPDDMLFDEMVEFVRLTKPDIVLGEMTPPNDMCFEDHMECARKIEALGYQVTVTDRLPSDCCGDLTHRDRWIMIARLNPVGSLNIADWADKQVQPAHSILDPLEDVDPRLWIDGSITYWDEYRMKNKMPLENITSADVGQFITHAYRFGHLEGHMSEKGTKIIDVWKGPLPTTTRFANDIIVDRRAPASGRQLRLMSMSEYARAASFHDDIEWLRSLDDNDWDGGPRAFAVIAGAIPRNMFHTCMRICCYELLKSHGVNTNYTLDVELDAYVGVHQFELSPGNISEYNLLHDATNTSAVDKLSKHVLSPQRTRSGNTTARAPSSVLPALFLVHCATCCPQRTLTRGTCFTRDDMHFLGEMVATYDREDSDDDDESSTVRPAVHKPGRVTPNAKHAWSAYISDHQSPEYRNAVQRADKYHQITHHSADKMEKNIAAGNTFGTGCKPGDSRYLTPCPICMSTGIDRINRHHKSREVSTRDLTTLPGEKWLLDGNDLTVYTEWGSFRSCLHFTDSTSYYRISFPVRTANAIETLDAFRYVINFTKMTLGRDVKSIYTDYATSFLSDRATDFLSHHGTKLEVCPPDCHWLNGVSEETVHSQTRAMRVRTPNLKGFEIKGQPVKHHERWWIFANEHATQAHNNSVYAPLERKHGHPITPAQAFFGDSNLKPFDVHTFGEPCYMIIKKEKRHSKLNDTAELCRYMFNAGWNPITNVLADCPRAHVVLRPNGSISVTAKVVFPNDRLSRHRDRANDTIDPRQYEDRAKTVNELERATDHETLRVQQLYDGYQQLRRRQEQAADDDPEDAPRPPSPPPAPAAPPHAADSVPDAPTPPSPDDPPPPEPAPVPAPAVFVPDAGPSRSAPVVPAPVPAPDAPAIAPRPPADPPQDVPVDPGGTSSGGALHERMPRANFFKDKDIPIHWHPAKAKRTGTQSGREYQIYSQSTTTREFYAHEGGRLATKHFDNDLKRGIFTFTEEPYRSLQHQVMRAHAADSAYQRTRLRTRLGYLNAHALAHSHGGALFIQQEKQMLETEFNYKLVKNLPFVKVQKFNSVLDTDNATMLQLESDVYSELAHAFVRHVGTKPSHVDPTWDTNRPENGFEGFHNDSYAAMHDVNEELDDQLLFWMTDERVNEFVLVLEGESRMRPNDALLYSQAAVDRDVKTTNDTPVEGKLEPDDFKIDELTIRELKEYSGEERQQMAKAVAKEIRDLAALGTFAWVEVPDDRRAMSSKLVLKIKYKADGQLDKFKGRLVARGFEGRPGIDFFGTFAPMASLTTVRTVFACAVYHGLSIIHCDIPNAFLQSEIDVEQFLMLPQGITVEPKNALWNSINTHGWDNRVVKLLKSIYGLKSAPQLFNKLLSQCLETDLGMTRGTADPCIYTFQNEQGWVMLCSEVDDLVITGTNTEKISEARTYFTEKFKLKDWDDPIKSFLGININYDMTAGRLEMDVEDKVKKTFEKHPALKTARVRHTPLPSKEDKVISADAPETPLQTYIRENYASIVGAFIYMSITCRPDIAFAIGRTSRGMHNPQPQHVRMLEYLCGYLKAYPHLKLVYQRSGNSVEQHLSHLSKNDSALVTISDRSFKQEPLFGMTDSDYANTREDSRKSISGYCFFVYCNLVSWKSKLQPITAASTHEAELIAMSFAADEAIWTRRLLMEIGFAIPAIHHIRPTDPTSVDRFPDELTDEWVAEMRPEHLPKQQALAPTWLLGDNQSAIFTSNNPETSQRSKHLEIRWFRIRDYIKDLSIQVRHIRTGDNIADFFTKALQGNESFNRLRAFLMGRQDFTPLKRL